MINGSDESRSGIAYSALPRWSMFGLVLVMLVASHFQLRAVRETEVENPIRADALEYFAAAINLKRFGIFSTQWPRDGVAPAPDAVRTPGYPIFLVAFIDSAEKPYIRGFLARVTLAQALLGILLVPLSYLLARTLLPTAPSLAVAFAVAITPQLVTSSTYLLTENIFAFAACVSLLALVASVARGSAVLALAAGLAIGVASLIRPTLQYLPFALIVLMPLLPDGLRRKRLVLWLVLGFTLPFGAWTARNITQLGEVADSRITVGTIHHGSYPHFMYENNPATFGYPYDSDPEAARISASMKTVLAHVARQFRERPAQMLAWYLIEKPFYLVAWEPIQGAGDVFIYEVARSPYLTRPEFLATKQLMRAFHWPLMLLAYAGAILVWLPLATRVLGERATQVGRLLSIVMAYVVAIHIVGAPFPRYSVPFRPLQYVLAMAALVIAVRWFRSRRA